MIFELSYSDFPTEVRNWISLRTTQWSYESKTKITKTDDGAVNAEPVIFVNIADEKVAMLFALTWV